VDDVPEVKLPRMYPLPSLAFEATYDAVLDTPAMPSVANSPATTARAARQHSRTRVEVRRSMCEMALQWAAYAAAPSARSRWPSLCPPSSSEVLEVELQASISYEDAMMATTVLKDQVSRKSRATAAHKTDDIDKASHPAAIPHSRLTTTSVTYILSGPHSSDRSAHVSIRQKILRITSILQVRLFRLSKERCQSSMQDCVGRAGNPAPDLQVKFPCFPPYLPTCQAETCFRSLAASQGCKQPKPCLVHTAHNKVSFICWHGLHRDLVINCP
jgi:hypothetical protein